MLGRQNIMTAEKALHLILENMPSHGPGEMLVRIEESQGMICSREIVSSEDLPAFSRSTVDGYAVRAEDTFGATETMPAYLTLFHEIFMGKDSDFSLSPGNASKIPTGGMLPGSSTAVVMFEHVQTVDSGMIEVLKPVAPGENVIQAGEDVRKGEMVIRRGHRMRPQDIGACAGIGITEIWVYRRPRVSIISTGDEVLPAELSPQLGQVRDVNSYVLAGMAVESGALPLRKGIFRDDFETIRDVMESSLTDSDLILVSGGTSVGIKDMVARVINDMGAPGVIFHGVSLKPGKPMIGGVVNGIPVFGLPGHPAAVSVCFDIFIRPVLKVLSGIDERFPFSAGKIVKARLAKNISSSQGREEHVRVMLEERDGGLWAVPVLGKSGLIKTLVRADGTIIIPLNSNGVESGELVDVRLF